MSKMFSILAFSGLLLAMVSCNQPANNNQETVEVVTEEVVAAPQQDVLTIDELMANAENLLDKPVAVKVLVDHICRHSGRRLNVVNAAGDQELHIELMESVPAVDTTIIGKTIVVEGNLIPYRMSAEMISDWEKREREHHKGHEESLEFKQAIEEIDAIKAKMASGEITEHTTYHLDGTKITM